MSFHIYLHAHVWKVHAEVCGEVLLNKEVLLQAAGWEGKTNIGKAFTYAWF
jgi:hypothetical protein